MVSTIEHNWAYYRIDMLRIALYIDDVSSGNDTTAKLMTSLLVDAHKSSF